MGIGRGVAAGIRIDNDPVQMKEGLRHGIVVFDYLDCIKGIDGILRLVEGRHVFGERGCSRILLVIDTRRVPPEREVVIWGLRFRRITAGFSGFNIGPEDHLPEKIAVLIFKQNNFGG